MTERDTRSPNARRADKLEAESGKRLEDYPYAARDFNRRHDLRDLDRLRAVEYMPYRVSLWKLYWLTLAEHGAVEPEAGIEWKPSDRDFDIHRAALPAELNGVLRAEWLGFNRRADEWARKRYIDTGVMVPDADRRAHAAQFAAVLRKRYGHAQPDAFQDVGDP